jgi:hypothetical protein
MQASLLLVGILCLTLDLEFRWRRIGQLHLLASFRPLPFWDLFLDGLIVIHPGDCPVGQGGLLFNIATVVDSTSMMLLFAILLHFINVKMSTIAN